jgi:4-alpha-glucanotransferase
MNDVLRRLSARYGIEDAYISATGEHRPIPDEIKLSLLAAMGVDSARVVDLANEDAHSPSHECRAVSACYVPDWLKNGRVWGVTTQLYAISSDRNQGIGDFEDLARLAELAAVRGADFVGVNPLHALFWDDPDRCSPYFPSTREFLNPLYIAIDVLPFGAEVLAGSDRDFRNTGAVAYAAISQLKHRALREIFTKAAPGDDPAFRKFCAEHGDDLENFARFETISAFMANQGFESGWPNWPREFQDPHSTAVAAVLDGEVEAIQWHKWMQWIAHDQLAKAQERAIASGMRIGLYLDIAVGVAPDGAATWSDRELVTAKARIGCPPDEFNAMGQDWGLAPIIPSALRDRSMEPFEQVLHASAGCAGAVRIDHAMALERLYWIPEGRDARAGGYVRYPREDMLDVLARVSQDDKTIIIGEDLGTVPGDFRDRMREREIHSYRVFYFERDSEGEFADPRTYPTMALACIGTHDLPTIHGWWSGRDIETRVELGLILEGAAGDEISGRHENRRRLLTFLARNGFEHAMQDDTSRGVADDIVVDLHTCMAGAPCRLFAVQLEDIAGMREQINLPGTHREYPNWRAKLPLKLEDIFASSLAVRTLEAVSRVRARHQ